MPGAAYGNRFGTANPPPGGSGPFSCQVRSREQAEALCALYGFGAVSHLELAEEAAGVLLHGVRREVERARDLAVGCTGRHQLEHFPFTLCQLERRAVALRREDGLAQADEPHGAHDLRAGPVLRNEPGCARRL